MFFTDVITQLSFLIVLCFSFFIFTFTLSINHGSPLTKLIGLSLFIPFFLTVVSFISSDKTVSASLTAFSEPALCLMIFILTVFKPEKTHYKAFRFLIILLPIMIVLAAMYSDKLPGYMSKPYITLPLLLLGASGSFHYRRRTDASKALLFRGVCCMLAAGLFGIFSLSQPVFYLLPALRLASYLLIALFVVRAAMEKLMQKVSEAEQKIQNFDRSVELEIKKRTFEIERVNEKLVNISKTDALSKAMNKAAIIETMEKLIRSKVSEFSIIIFDIDNFKEINDSLGHITGDKCIRKLALIARSCIRDIDHLGRYGGDEFLVVFPGTDATQAKLIAERLRKKVDADTLSPHFTISVGVAAYPHDAKDVEALISFADEGLYISKDKGKNAVSHKDLF